MATLALPCAVVSILGCRSATRGQDDLRTRLQAVALAWAEAFGTGDATKLSRLTADPFIIRGVGTDRRCQGRISGKTAFDEWLGCMRAKEDLQQAADAWGTFRKAPPHSPESAEFERYLPHVVDADEAWSRFVGTDERARSREALDAISKEAGSGGEWVTIASSWLYTRMVLRLQVIGAADPRVHAVLVDITRTSD